MSSKFPAKLSQYRDAAAFRCTHRLIDQTTHKHTFLCTVHDLQAGTFEIEWP